MYEETNTSAYIIKYNKYQRKKQDIMGLINNCAKEKTVIG